MSNTPRDGGPAFPISVATSTDSLISSADFVNGEGMSLRDWFAGQALNGLLTGRLYAISGRESLIDLPQTAVMAYQLADAMLKAREK